MSLKIKFHESFRPFAPAVLCEHIMLAFYGLTGCPIVVNTSFNVKNEPIVCTPEDAYRCFMKTEMDVLVMESYIVTKLATAVSVTSEAILVAIDQGHQRIAAQCS